MLSRFQYEKINFCTEGSVISKIIEGLEFAGEPFDKVVLGVQVLADEISKTVESTGAYKVPEPISAIEFALAILVSKGKIALTPELRKALGVHEAPSAWHKPNPPTKYPALMTRWPEEAAHVGEIASKISFAALANAEAYRSATLEALSLGGWLDVFDPATIPCDDPTMTLFREGAMETLIGVQPAWFDSDCQPLLRLPDGQDGRSREAANADADWQKYLTRKAAAKKASEERRAKEIKEIQAARAYSFAQFEALPGWKDYVDGMLMLSCEACHKLMVEDEPSYVIKGTDKSTWILADTFITALLKLEDVVTGKANWIQLAEDFICFKLQAAQPSWFFELADGGWKIRKTALKTRAGGFDRKANWIRNGLFKLIRKHGVADVQKIFDEVKGQPIPAEDDADDKAADAK